MIPWGAGLANRGAGLGCGVHDLVALGCGIVCHCHVKAVDGGYVAHWVENSTPRSDCR